MLKYQINSKQDWMHHLYLQEINKLPTHTDSRVKCLFVSHSASLFRAGGSRALLSRILCLCGMHLDGGVW